MDKKFHWEDMTGGIYTGRRDFGCKHLCCEERWGICVGRRVKEVYFCNSWGSGSVLQREFVSGRGNFFLLFLGGGKVLLLGGNLAFS